MYFVIGMLITLAVLGPLFGADTRDGLDWAPGNFWLRRRSDGRGRRSHGRPRFTRTDSRAQASAARAVRDGGRTAPAAG
ncbi:hypothetical protein SAMN04489712_102676 [Thermomonospora echinospora]|uniref:Uncharacterized protein n=1 Tax=Thermomonospora echinospora TaxID=1992 RepID=A0A1H5WCV4_9ACTN|nr:hypothetical protein SAMN04489712_102676 [Thermomonospora echinospora]